MSQIPEKSEKPKTANRQITLTKAKEILEEFGVPPDTATTFRPVFSENVDVIGPTSIQDVNKLYCLSAHSALQLMMVLSDLGPVGYLDEPIDMATGSTFYYSRRVPWLKFADGTIRNAGQLAQFWASNYGDPGGKTADMMARQDIAWGN